MRERLHAWHADAVPRVVASVNLSEVLVGPSSDPVLLRRARAALEVRTHLPSEPLAVEAARLRGTHPVSFPDAYLLATAAHLGAGLCSFDRTVRRAAAAEGLAVG